MFVVTSGPQADALMAAHLCSEAALRLVKPGNETYEITETVSKIAEAFDCKVQPQAGFLKTLVASLFDFNFSACGGHVVTPAGAKQNRRRENDHPEPIGGPEERT